MKNKIVTKVILTVVCVATLVVTFVVPSFASIDIPNASNPSTSQYSFPSGTLHVGIADPDLHLVDADGYDANIPFFNYAGAGSEQVVSFDLDENTPMQGALVKNFSRSMLYTDVNVLANTGFDGLYNNFTTRYNLLGGNYGNTVRLKGFTFDDIVLLNTKYSFIQILGEVSDYLYGNLSNVTAHYNVTYYDRLAKNYKSKSVDVPLTWNASSNYFVFEFCPQELDFDGDLIYCSNYSVTFEAISRSDTPVAFDIIEPRLETRLAVPRLNVYNDYQSMINQDFYLAGQNSIEEGSFNFFESIISTVNSFMSWEFIPNISFGLIATLAVGTFVMLAFLKFFAGG